MTNNAVRLRAIAAELNAIADTEAEPPVVTLPDPVPVPPTIPTTPAPMVLPRNRDRIEPAYGAVPAAGETRTVAGTGLQLKKVAQGLIVYSRYSPFSCDNKLVLVHGENSTSCKVIDHGTGQVVRDLPSLGEVNELRWDANDPNTLYYVKGMAFYSLNVTSGAAALIRDFTKDFPGGSQILNDVEGDSSLDSRYWAWMVRQEVQTGSYPTIAIFTYDKFKNVILGKMTLATEGLSTTFVRPNMVEISPDGKWCVVHWQRAYKGWNDAEISTHRNGPHVYPLNLRRSEAVWLCPEATHCGWVKDGNVWKLAFQNDRTDYLEVIEPGVPYKEDGSNQLRIAYQGEFDKDWNMGWHIAKCSLPYVIVSTYSPGNKDWADNQVYAYPLEANAMPIRIAPSYSQYPGDDAYRNEAPAAVSADGKLIAWSHNHGGADKRSAYVARLELPG